MGFGMEQVNKLKRERVERSRGTREYPTIHGRPMKSGRRRRMQRTPGIFFYAMASAKFTSKFRALNRLWMDDKWPNNKPQ
jgi:hypothetical protein